MIVLHGLAILFTFFFLPGLVLGDDINVPIVILAILIILVNSKLRPALLALKLPFNTQSIIISTLFINTVSLLVIDYFFEDITVTSFWWAITFGIIISIINWLMSLVLKQL